MSYWVYMLLCADGTLYTGSTDDVDRRAAAHNAGKGAKYTRGRGPVSVVYREACADKSAALRREVAIKRLSRAEKRKLCTGVPQRDATKVSAAIVRRGGKILICKRGPGGSCAHLWEFPGGKAEPGESLEDCLVRECREELDARVRPLRHYLSVTHTYPERTVELHFFEAELLSPGLKPLVHEDLRWAEPRDLDQYEFCPADAELIQRLSGE